MTMTLAPPAMPAPLTRSRATTVGAVRASRSGSSPPARQPRRAGATETGAPLARAVPRRIDHGRPAERSAVAAAEEHRPFAGPRQHARDGQRGGRLAGAADRPIAESNDGDTPPPALPPR